MVVVLESDGFGLSWRQVEKLPQESECLSVIEDGRVDVILSAMNERLDAVRQDADAAL